MRIAAVFTKEAPVRFVSHLDVQRLFHRAFRRAKLPLAFSQGFNPHPLVSFATALSVGFTSRGEYMDVVLTEDIPIPKFVSRVNTALPEGVRIVEAFDLGESRKSLTSAMKTASYSVKAVYDRPVDNDLINKAVEELLSNEIVVMKKTKGGIKPTDIRPMVLSVDIVCTEGNLAEFNIKGVLSAEGGLNPEMLMTELNSRLGSESENDIERTEIELDRSLLS